MTIVHYPDTAEARTELSQRFAAFHARAVIDYINALPCGYEEKLELIERIEKIHRDTHRMK